MPGMQAQGVANANPVVVAAFHHSLVVGFLLVAGLLLIGSFTWLLVTSSWTGSVRASWSGEPRARRVLRIGFGLLWLVDALLQLQPQMPLGLPGSVLLPSAEGSPGWVVSLTTWGAHLWERQPVHAAAATVFVQLGIALWLLLAARGPWSRLGGLASVLWGLIVWSVGNAFGGLLAPGPSLLFGQPGSSLLYAIAGALLLAPDDAWRHRRLPRGLARGLGVGFGAFGVLQAWPGRGFWQGTRAGGHGPGPIAAMAQSMAATPQPHGLSVLVGHVGHLSASHPVLINALAVGWMLGVTALLLVASPRSTTAAAMVGCGGLLIIWVVIADLGVFGGTATDPNSMVPLGVLLSAAGIGVRRAAVGVEADDRAEQVAQRSTPRSIPRITERLVGAVAMGIVAVGAIPLGIASASNKVDPILGQILNSGPQYENYPALDFHLVDQRSHPRTLESFAHKVVVLTFLDPVCTNDCPTIGQELLAADRDLGPAAKGAAFVAVDANPTYTQPAVLVAFSSAEGLNAEPNWFYLTGSLRQLRNQWAYYGAQVYAGTNGSMAVHDDVVYLVDGRGHVRMAVSARPGNTAVLRDGFSAFLASQVERFE